jgi:hypothetical protein
MNQISSFVFILIRILSSIAVLVESFKPVTFGHPETPATGILELFDKSPVPVDHQP